MTASESKRRIVGLQSSERRLILIIGDLLSASVATFLALAAWAQFDWLGFSLDFILARGSWFIFLPPIWALLMANLYDVRRAGSWRETIRGVILAAGGGIVVYLVAYFTSDPGSLPRRGVLYYLILAVVFTLIWRWLYIRILSTSAFMRRVMIVGAGDSGRTLLQAVKKQNPLPFHVVGIIDDDPQKQGKEFEGFEVLGDNSSVLELVERETVSELIVAILGPMNGEMFQALLDAQQRGIQITRMPVAYEDLQGRVPIHHLESDWLLRSFVDELRVSSFYLIIKRILDILGGMVGLLIFLLTYPWVALAIMLESGRPVIFRQERVGQGGRIFKIIKYRTMHQDAEADGVARWPDEEGDPRTTAVGRILRKTYLDEFPQFWNVLIGDMSMVGPRPERPEFISDLEKEIPFYRARLLVKPGIGGWAQINAGKGASVAGSAEKLEFDLYYIKHRTVLIDLWIILRTVGAVVGFSGV